MTEDPPRYFVASPTEVQPVSHEGMLRNMGVSPAVSAAYDLLTDDGLSPDKAAGIVLAAERNGDDPEVFARHLIELRKATRQ